MRKFLVAAIIALLIFTFSSNAITAERPMTMLFVEHEPTSELLPVYRERSNTRSLIKEATESLINIELTDKEKVTGLRTGFEEIEEVQIVGVDLKDGKVTIEFEDPNFELSGGSDRVRSLREQMNRTIKMNFPEVEQINYLPGHVFQP